MMAHYLSRTKSTQQTSSRPWTHQPPDRHEALHIRVHGRYPRWQDDEEVRAKLPLSDRRLGNRTIGTAFTGLGLESNPCSDLTRRKLIVSCADHKHPKILNSNDVLRTSR